MRKRERAHERVSMHLPVVAVKKADKMAGKVWAKSGRHSSRSAVIAWLIERSDMRKVIEEMCTVIE